MVEKWSPDLWKWKDCSCSTGRISSREWDQEQFQINYTWQMHFFTKVASKWLNISLAPQNCWRRRTTTSAVWSMGALPDAHLSNSHHIREARPSIFLTSAIQSIGYRAIASTFGKFYWSHMLRSLEIAPPPPSWCLEKSTTFPLPFSWVDLHHCPLLKRQNVRISYQHHCSSFHACHRMSK